MRFKDKYSTSIYVSTSFHKFFSEIAQNTPYSIGDLYILSALSMLGEVPPDLDDPDIDHKELALEVMNNLKVFYTKRREIRKEEKENIE